jgi:hypothetical protein
MTPQEAKELVDMLNLSLLSCYYAVFNGEFIEIHKKEEEPTEQIKFHF